MSTICQELVVLENLALVKINEKIAWLGKSFSSKNSEARWGLPKATELCAMCRT